MAAINILYTFDTRFWRLAMISMYSVLRTQAADTNVNIYCMVAPHTRGQRKIRAMADTFPGTKIIWRPIKRRENTFRKYAFSRWSPVIFYRLFAHKIFPDLDKVLYLDSDTIVHQDLGRLYNTDISEYIIGAVMDMAATNDPHNPNGVYVSNFSRQFLNRGPYFNSGVLLINLKKLAEYNELLTKTTIPLKYPDQDLMNVAFAGKIKSLDLKYNIAPDSLIPTTFPKPIADDAKQHPVIWHFYYAKPYEFDFMPNNVYSEFYHIAQSLGIHPDDLARHEFRHTKRLRRHSIKFDGVPLLRLHGNRLKLLGITLTELD